MDATLGYIGGMTLERLAGSVICAGFPGTEVPDVLARRIARSELAGIILFRRNLTEPVATPRMIDALVRAAPTDEPPLVAIDEEGGRVRRFREPVLALPPMRRVGMHGDRELTRTMGRALGTQLRALGITVDFAPVLDVDTNPANPIIGDRAFGADADTVIEHAFAFADGLADAGIAACGKHFPGHGDTELDSHLALPIIRHDRARLDRVELAPFRRARGRVPMIMTAHVVFDSLDPGVPATLSRSVVTGLLKGELGYGGVVVSDDLEMKAVADRHGIAESAVMSIDAGCDLLLICSRTDEVDRAADALAERASRDAAFRSRLENAAAKVLALRQKFRPTPVVDESELAARLSLPEAQLVARAWPPA